MLVGTCKFVSHILSFRNFLLCIDSRRNSYLQRPMAKHFACTRSHFKKDLFFWRALAGPIYDGQVAERSARVGGRRGQRIGERGLAHGTTRNGLPSRSFAFLDLDFISTIHHFHRHHEPPPSTSADSPASSLPLSQERLSYFTPRLLPYSFGRHRQRISAQSLSASGRAILYFILHRQQKMTKKSSSGSDTTTELLFKLVWLGAIVYGVGFFLYYAYEIRLQAIKEFGPVIHEFDPYFNWRATQVSGSTISEI